VRSWGPHSDVVEPLKRMGERYKLLILSNADDSFVAESAPRLEADFRTAGAHRVGGLGAARRS